MGLDDKCGDVLVEQLESRSDLCSVVDARLDDGLDVTQRLMACAALLISEINKRRHSFLLSFRIAHYEPSVLNVFEDA